MIQIYQENSKYYLILQNGKRLEITYTEYSGYKQFNLKNK
jgi:hypothetical protein